MTKRRYYHCIIERLSTRAKEPKGGNWGSQGSFGRSQMTNQKMHWLIITIAVTFAFASKFELLGAARTARGTITVQTKTSANKDVKNLGQLIERLRAGREKVRRKGRVEQPFFSVKGQIITLGHQDVQIFQYRSVKAAELDARKVSSTGSSAGTSMPMWIAPPHFFKSGRLIVLYVGEESSVLKALETALGPQFAGR
jgi:hypothetical protein